ncbi:hypothetical protein DSL72_003513 [Monilinia vaccinii-corymbosi]|uniref:Uncharacterized protein n=1 Tax=Monilinia vaccinii-corymbosi TaxID=61207 RepID=A0A8A3NZW4_9HELO|nr:hypothetical protein DSL72_003513 [Monilinia vaccinii-corymbosi]
MVVTNMTPVEVGLHHMIIFHSGQFWMENPTFPKDLRFLGQVLTLARIAKGRFINFDTDLFVAFIGVVYLPYLQKERNNNPMSPYALWIQNNYRDHQRNRKISICDDFLRWHAQTSFDVAFEASMMENCKFVLELFKEAPQFQETFDLKPDPVPVPNLELELVLADRALEAKSREPGMNGASK